MKQVYEDDLKTHNSSYNSLLLDHCGKQLPNIFGEFGEIVSLLFALDHPHYSRCLSVILCIILIMIQLEKIHPEIAA